MVGFLEIIYMDYNFLTKKKIEPTTNQPVKTDYSFLVPKKTTPAPSVPTTPTTTRTVGLPEHLGGGQYLTNGTGSLIKSPRSQDALPAVGTAERDHIISVALGGTSDKKNLQYLATTREGRQEGKVSVEQKAINDYVSGKISLGEARLKVATKQQQIKGLTPTEKEQTWQGQIGNVIKEGAKSLIGGILQAPQRALTSVAIQPIADIMGVEAKFEPTTKLEKIIFGKEPITGMFTRTDEAEGSINQALNKAGINPDVAKGIALATAPLFVGLMTALDLTPIGGEKNAAKKIASSKNVDEIADLIRPIFKGASESKIKSIAEPLVEIGTAKGVKEYLQNGAKKTIDNVIESTAKTAKATQAKKASILPSKPTAITTLKGKNALSLAPKAKSAIITPEIATIAKKQPIKYTPIEKPADLRKKITTEKLIGTPSTPTRIKNETIEKGLKADFSGIPDYDKVSFKDQAIKVGEIIDENPSKAIKIALGEELPTNGALPESVFTAVKNQAIKNKDTDLLVQLATAERGVARESTILGQRIKMLDEGLEDDAFRNIKEVVKNRQNVFEAKGGKLSQAKSKELANIKGAIAKTKPKIDDWKDFVESLKCKT